MITEDVDGWDKVLIATSGCLKAFGVPEGEKPRLTTSRGIGKTENWILVWFVSTSMSSTTSRIVNDITSQAWFTQDFMGLCLRPSSSQSSPTMDWLPAFL